MSVGSLEAIESPEGADPLIADGGGRLSRSADAAATSAAVAPDTSLWVCLFSVHHVMASLTQASIVHTGSITPSS